MGFDEAALSRSLQRLPWPKAYLLAFSGGLDSSVLLHLLARLRSQDSPGLRAIHIHHGLLPHADAWSRHCETVCDALQVPLEVVRLSLQVPPGASIEAFAREARYAALADALGTHEMLLTAQHRDDQAETLMLQLLRGAGIEGLAGMPLLRQWGDGWHARPLLDVGRDELLQWARQQGIEWVEDQSNQDRRFDRNYLRHEVMPLLRQRWPAAGATLARSAQNLASSLSVLREEAAVDLDHCRDGPSVRRTELLLLSSARRALVLRAWCRERGYPAPDRRRLQTIESQLGQEDGSPNWQVDWADVSLRCYRECLYLTPRVLPPLPDADLPWPGGLHLVLPQGCGELTLRTGASGIPAHLWEEGRVSIAWPQPGMRCRVLRREGTRSLKKLCQEWGVPAWIRPFLPLVRVDGQLAAIAGFALCAEFPGKAAEPLLRPEWSGMEGYAPVTGGRDGA